MRFCSKRSERMLCSYSCSISPRGNLSASSLSVRTAGSLLSLSVSLEWARAASYAAFQIPSQANRR
jgi:hypothetical protein